MIGTVNAVGFESPRGVAPEAPAAADGVRERASRAGWGAVSGGVEELANVSGEEFVDESELTRDDPLGRLVTRAFGSAVPDSEIRAIRLA